MRVVDIGGGVRMSDYDKPIRYPMPKHIVHDKNMNRLFCNICMKLMGKNVKSRANWLKRHGHANVRPLFVEDEIMKLDSGRRLRAKSASARP
jgi:hypothetical protein